MAQTTVKLKKIDITNYKEMEFALKLRNDNADYFFRSAKVDWWDHVKWFRSNASNTAFEFFIIMCNNKRAGTLAVEHRASCEFLQNLCVHKDFRGRGLAKKAITKLMKPNRFIVAQVKSDNRKVIKMYDDLGFWQVKR